MQTKYLKFLIVFLSILSILFFNCTENPFFGDTDISGNSIRGTVKLSNYLSPDDVYVWFKALNLSTRTDKNGEFTLHIPPPGKQPGGGIDGIYDLYFFVTNYQWQSVQIFFLNGNIQYSKLSLNNEGELKKPIVLSEILKIKMSLGPKMYTEILEDSIHVYFTVNTYNEPMTLVTTFSNPLYQGDPEFLTGFLLDSNKNVVKMFQRKNRTFRSVEIEVGSTPKTLAPMIAIIAPGEFPQGEYYVVPYLVIKQKNLPSGLLESLGVNIRKFSEDFLKVPLKITNNKFIISN